MANSICLDENYSTTKLLIKEKIEIAKKTEDKFESALFLQENENRKGEGGLRKKGYFKKSYENKPLISIVTVVYNGEQFLEETIQSVINQTYDNVEYIIIDGGSTDRTVDIIKKYEDKINYWISEKDSGLYDAMNKGIDLAFGDWINFMNAGDEFYSVDVLDNIFLKKDFQDVNIIYGDTDIGRKILKYKKNLDINDFAQGMVICHQSTFYKKNKNIKYNLNYKICGDQDYTIQYLKNNKASFYLSFPVSKYDLNGISSSNLHKIIHEKFLINKSYSFSHLPILKSYVMAMLLRIRKIFIGY